MVLKSLTGYFLFLLAAFLLCENKRARLAKSWRPIVLGILFQLVVLFALTNVPVCVSAIECIASGVMKLKDATIEGTKFVFGYVGGGDLPFEMKEGGMVFVFAFQVLPTVILVSALSALLTHFRILPFFSKIIGYVFRTIFRISSNVGMVAAAKIFVGQLEAPLLIRHKLPMLPRSEMFIILALAFATTSAAVMPIYASVLNDICPDAMRHIIISTVIGVISVLIVSSIAMPSESASTSSGGAVENNSPYSSFMNAVTKGLSDGAFVWWCIVGSLIGTIALIALVNYILALLPDYAGTPITLQRIFGVFMYPFAWLMGIDAQDLTAVSQIIGTKMAVNETVAFFDLAKAGISPESVVKTIYAINNFGNFSCIGITVAGLSAIAPGQKSITELVGRAFVAGFLATGLSSTLFSVFFTF